MFSDAKVMTLIMGMMDFRQMHKEVLITESFYDIRTNVKKITHSDTLNVCDNLQFTILKSQIFKGWMFIRFLGKKREGNRSFMKEVSYKTPIK